VYLILISISWLHHYHVATNIWMVSAMPATLSVTTWQEVIPPNDFYQNPLVYQTISHGFMAWNDPIKLPSDDVGIDFEAEIATITGNVSIGVNADEVHKYIHLFALLNTYPCVP